MTELLAPAYSASKEPEGVERSDWARGEERVDELYALLSTYPNLDWIAPDLDIATIAAGFRARYQLTTLGALQAATAVQARVTGLVTDNPVFERIEAFEALVLKQDKTDLPSDTAEAV